MTTLSIRKSDKTELQAHIDAEVAAYKVTVQGNNPFTGDRSALGAIVPIFLETKGNQDRPLVEFAKLIEQGYQPTATVGLEAKLVLDQYKMQSMTVYVIKPEAEQANDIAAIKAKATETYERELEDHNDNVFAQEAQALKAEEARIAAELKAEDEAMAASKFERRVRERMRGARSSK